MSPTATKTTLAVFHSKITALRVLLESEVPPQYNSANAMTAQKQPEKVAQFVDGRYVADEGEAKRLGYESVAHLAGALTEHSGFGGEFFDVPNEVVAPDATETLQRIAVLAAAGDREEIESVAADEAESWQRQAVLDQCEMVLAAFDAAFERQQAAQSA